MDKRKNKVLATVFKLSVLLISIGYIFYLFKEGKLQLTTIADGFKSFDFASVSFISFCVFAIINWGLEGLKWYVLCNNIGKSSYLKALKSVLMGLGLSLVLPKNIGDFIGRLMGFSPHKRSALTGALILSRSVQLFITILFGILGFYLFGTIMSDSADIVIYMLIILFFLPLLYLLIRKVPLKFKHLRKNILRFILRSFQSFQSHSWHLVLLIFGIGISRYLVFICQFLLVFSNFGEDYALTMLLAGICMTLLLKSVVVSFNFLNDIGVREASALAFLSFSGLSENSILIGSLIIWVFNILLPSLIGYFVFMGQKMKVA